MHRYELHPIGEPAPIDEHIAELLERAAMNQHRAEVDRMLTEGRRAALQCTREHRCTIPPDSENCRPHSRAAAPGIHPPQCQGAGTPDRTTGFNHPNRPR